MVIWISIGKELKNFGPRNNTRKNGVDRIWVEGSIQLTQRTSIRVPKGITCNKKYKYSYRFMFH